MLIKPCLGSCKIQFLFFSGLLRTGHLKECRHANLSKVKINNSCLSCFDYLNADIKSPEIQLNPYLLPVREKKKKTEAKETQRHYHIAMD